MIGALMIAWLVEWRWFVRPVTADQHCHATRHLHTVVQYGGGHHWYCENCEKRCHYHGPMTNRDKQHTAWIGAKSAVIVAAGYFLAQLIGLAL